MSSLQVVDEEVVQAVVSMVRERLPEGRVRVLEEFARQYLAGVSTEDLVGFEPADLYGATVAHWNFLDQRDPAQAKVRVYNPQYDAHGWRSTHTIVEVVTPDMPFLVDSVRMAVDRRGLTVHLLIHPVVRLWRDSGGNAVSLGAQVGDPAASQESVEAVMHFEVDRLTDPAAMARLEEDVRGVLADVAAAVKDWRPMRSHLEAILEQLKSAPAGVDPDSVQEAREFLTWVDANHYTFLGYAEYDLVREGSELKLFARDGSGLGILRHQAGEAEGFSQLPGSTRELALLPELLVLTKSNSLSTVHRPSHLDYVGVKQFDAEGKVVGEKRFLGLYTSAAYNRVPRDIPLLRNRVRRVVERAGYPHNSHAAKALHNILDNFPRDELFQLTEDELYETVTGILHLQERRRIRLFVHRDLFGRFYSCIVFLPKERYNTDNRLAIQRILEEALGAHESDFNVYLSASVLARLYFLLRVDPGERAEFDAAQLEQRLRDATRAWADDLSESVLEHFGEERGVAIMHRYREAFRADYRENYPARAAVLDIERMESLEEGGERLSINLYRPLEAQGNVLGLKMLHLGAPVSLSDGLPMLENMGLRVIHETPSKIKRNDGPRLWIHDFGLTLTGTLGAELDRLRPLFQEAFAEVFWQRTENDGFNRLVLAAGLNWRQILVLRAYCKYLRQLGFTFSQSYMEAALTEHPQIARRLCDLFDARFNPSFDGDRDAAQSQLVERIRNDLDDVANLDEDRILRAYLGLIRATLRTNHFQRAEDGAMKPYLSLKLDPAGISEMPKPRPMYEIFVYSPRVEGVHLRGGPVARGGLRWSDRREDFRTEVLGLVKAQMVKNAVIVPVGSKGGFYPKQLPSADREAMQREGIACYQTFIRGLLDVTDNLAAGEVRPPPEVIRHDGDDPYLVVAADKGTATFSDIANEIAAQYGFWLGDAFASGGSAGYDHKGMGITAKGAWESVKRHFRELGLDTQSEEFTVVGVGDMSGDVFGNGMLLSRHIKLVGAFNHLHIFIDPDPDPERSSLERERMFKLPRSSWEDYDPASISEGGGVYPRSLKSISVNGPMREVFGLAEEVTSMTPTELISAILKAPVDLLWNGGIGTYVKASSERNAEVGDRANDALRVDGNALRCRVLGEGGNLGVTQLGRIEFAQADGRVNTDAIDNSAGVDCSDHEVNIKILLNAVVEAGDMTGKQRNQLLAQMTDEVGELVVRDNYLQTQSLSMACRQSISMFDVHTRLMRDMERSGALDRAIEYLPAEDEVVERRAAKRGLTAPELSVLLAYVKIGLYQNFLGSDLPGDPFLISALREYFPSDLRQRFESHISEHRLAPEIVSTVVSNELVNRAGITFCYRMREETGAAQADIARAYLVAREVFDMPVLWQEIEALDNQARARGQLATLLEARRLSERAARWLLRNRPRPLDMSAAIEQFRDGVTTVAGLLRGLAGETQQAVASSLRMSLAADGIPEPLAERVSWYPELDAALDIVTVATDRELDVEQVARSYFALGRSLSLDWLKEQVVNLPRDNRWQALARAALRDELFARERALVSDMLASTGGDDDEHRVQQWLADNRDAAARCHEILGDLRASAVAPDFAMLSVAMGEIRSLERSG